MMRREKGSNLFIFLERQVKSTLLFIRYQFKVEVEVRDENGEEVKNERL